jgi:hypothetical protein
MMQGCMPDRKLACVKFILSNPLFVEQWVILSPDQVRKFQTVPAVKRPKFDLSLLAEFGDFVTQHPPVEESVEPFGEERGPIDDAED